MPISFFKIYVTEKNPDALNKVDMIGHAYMFCFVFDN